MSKTGKFQLTPLVYTIYYMSKTIQKISSSYVNMACSNLNPSKTNRKEKVKNELQKTQKEPISFILSFNSVPFELLFFPCKIAFFD